jgi:hypothetical protein
MWSPFGLILCRIHSFRLFFFALCSIWGSVARAEPFNTSETTLGSSVTFLQNELSPSDLLSIIMSCCQAHGSKTLQLVPLECFWSRFLVACSTEDCKPRQNARDQIWKPLLRTACQTTNLAARRQGRRKVQLSQ